MNLNVLDTKDFCSYWFLCFVIRRIDLFCRVGGRVYCSSV